MKRLKKILLEGKIGEVYNIGADNELTNLELTHKICEILDKLKPRQEKYSQLISFVKDRKGHDWRYAINSSKIQKDLHWQANSNLDSSLTKTVKYYLEKFR